jgi:hypothetical protein
VSAPSDELKRAKRKPLKTNNMNELQFKIKEMEIGYMEAKVQQLNPNVPYRHPEVHGYDTQDELFERILCLGAINSVSFIMESLSATQRADFWEYVRIANEYEREDNVCERQYMINFKGAIYKTYLNQ